MYLFFPKNKLFAILILVSTLGLVLFTTNRMATAAASGDPAIPMLVSNGFLHQDEADGMRTTAQAEGTINVIVQLNLVQPFRPEGELSRSSVARQQQIIQSAQDEIQGALPEENGEVYVTYDAIPAMALTVDDKGLEILLNSESVRYIQEDIPVPPSLASSTDHIGMPTVWNSGYDGTGQTVVILDTGIDGDHPFFEDDMGNSRIVAEACFSNAPGDKVSLCPNGTVTQTGSGASEVDGLAVCLEGGVQICDHGTHVAGIAAGNGASYDGVAPNANIVSIQVFSRVEDDVSCGGTGSAPCLLSYTSDQLSALNYIYTTLSGSYSVASANMSLGGGDYVATCDSSALKPAIDNLISIDIATVIATGNNGYTTMIGGPACISTAVSVGSTTDSDAVSSFSNVYPYMDLFAPGSAIDSAVPGGTFESKQGTSMATPHVAGAWAILKQVSPSATVTDVLDALTSTGIPVLDTRAGGVTTMPRIQMDGAVAALNTNTWSGATDSSWHVATNWSKGSVPTQTETAVIPASVTNPLVITGTGYAQNITIESGAAVTMTGGNLTVYGVWNEEGSGRFNGSGGTISLFGARHRTVTQTTASLFNDLRIGDGTVNTTINLGSELDVNGDFDFDTNSALNGGAQTIAVAGNWDSVADTFSPDTSTVVFDGVDQTVTYVPTSTLLSEDFNDYTSCCNLLHNGLLPSWVVKGSQLTVGMAFYCRTTRWYWECCFVG